MKRALSGLRQFLGIERPLKMKFGQLIECKTRNIFLEKSYTKRGGETSPILFSGKLKLSLSLDQ